MTAAIKSLIVIQPSYFFIVQPSKKLRTKEFKSAVIVKKLSNCVRKFAQIKKNCSSEPSMVFIFK